MPKKRTKLPHVWNRTARRADQAGSDGRRVDITWPMRNLFDLTPDGPGTT